MASSTTQGVLWRRDPREGTVGIAVHNSGTRTYRAAPRVFEQFREGRIRDGTCVQCQLENNRVVSVQELVFTSEVENWNEETAYVRCPFVPRVTLNTGDKTVKRCRIIKKPRSKDGKLPFAPALHSHLSLSDKCRLDFCSSIDKRRLQRTQDPPSLDVLPIKMVHSRRDANEPRPQAHQRYYEPLAPEPSRRNTSWMQNRMAGSRTSSEAGSVASSVPSFKRGKKGGGSTPKSRPRKKKKVAQQDKPGIGRFSRPGPVRGSRRRSRDSSGVADSDEKTPEGLELGRSRRGSNASNSSSTKKTTAYVPPHIKRRREKAALTAESRRPQLPSPPKMPVDAGLGLSLENGLPDLPEALDSDNDDLVQLSGRSGQCEIHTYPDNLPPMGDDYPPAANKEQPLVDLTQQQQHSKHDGPGAGRGRHLSLSSPLDETLPQLPRFSQQSLASDLARISLRSNIATPNEIPALHAGAPPPPLGGFHAPHTSRSSLTFCEQSGQRNSNVSEHMLGMFAYRPAPATPPNQYVAGRRLSAQSDPGPNRTIKLNRMTPSTSATQLPLLPECSPAGSTSSERFNYPGGPAGHRQQPQWQSGSWDNLALDTSESGRPPPRKKPSKLRAAASAFVPGAAFGKLAFGHGRTPSWSSAFSDRVSDEGISRQNTGQSAAMPMAISRENTGVSSGADGSKEMGAGNTLGVPRTSTTSAQSMQMVSRQSTLDSNNRQSTFNTNVSSAEAMSISRPSTLTQMQSESQSSLSVPRMSGTGLGDLPVIHDNKASQHGVPARVGDTEDGLDAELQGRSSPVTTDAH